ncbi:MAG TPA: FAD-dependent oxidoreductase, partial [Archangium sp.]|nr:FAD-dependent oxidoreductase [Archangium sp.]
MTKHFDVVIVGAGISGGLLANELALAGKSVLILEAGPASATDRSEYMETFYTSSNKFPESPYPPAIVNPNNQGELVDPATEAAGRATVAGLINATPLNAPDQKDKPYLSYLIQKDVVAKTQGTEEKNTAFASTYERMSGGTTQ